jgi:4'-phosphopantetheinyl transferase
MILTASTDRWPDEAAFFAELQRLPLAEQARILRKPRAEDRKATALGRILLLDGLAALGLPVSLMNSMSYAGGGRPYLPQGPAFNISHAGNRVVCAISPAARRVGVDVERLDHLTEASLGDLEETMTPAQWAAIRADADPVRRFLALWTMKESVVKATGLGLSLPPGELEGLGPVLSRADGESWRVEELALDDGHIGHVATRLS